jgi:putative transposase
VKRPVIGWVGMREPVRFSGNVKSAVVSRTADRWFVSLSVEVEHTRQFAKTKRVLEWILVSKRLQR